jgi:hypothetical protein
MIEHTKARHECRLEAERKKKDQQIAELTKRLDKEVAKEM